MRIFAASEWLIQGGRGESGRSLEGMQVCIILRKWDLKDNQEVSMSEDSSQEVEERRLLILLKSA